MCACLIEGGAQFGTFQKKAKVVDSFLGYSSCIAGGFLKTVNWNLKGAQVAILTSDTGAVEVVPWDKAYAEAMGVPFAPLHGDLIRNEGIMKADQLLFDELTENSAQDRVYKFLFVAAPLPLVRSPVAQGSPLAIK